jgi:RNA polymerase sigma-70 factor (ECF subfamily)
VEDSKIIKLFQKRSEKAIGELKKKYGAYMYRIGMNILNNVEDVEECMNDAQLKIWSSIPPLIPISLLAYSGKITRNIALDKYRKQHRVKRNHLGISMVLEELSDLVAGNENLEEIVESKVIIQCINEHLALLPKDKRLCFVLRYYYAYSIKEISCHLSMGESAVKMTLMRTRNELANILCEEELYE